MHVGFGLISCQLAPNDPRTWSDRYREAIDLCVLADRLGLDSVWTTEHHFVDDGYMPSLLVTSAAIAARTSRVAVGTGVVLAPMHDPLRLAEDAATVQLISEGRLVLGLGLGWSPIEFRAFGAARTMRGRAMTEILEILPKAWSGEPFEHLGAVYRLPRLGVRPAPDRPIPVWVGGGADAAVRRAARLADGFFSNAPEAVLARQIEVADRERARIGRDAEFTWTHYRYVYVADDPDEGWRTALPLLAQSRWKYSDMEASAMRPAHPVPAASRPTPEEEEGLRSVALVGPPDLIAQRVRATAEAAGRPLGFVARSYFPELDFGAQQEQVHRLAEEVAPLIRAG
jgi:alkanesulfonate monooxygenase SsuD/methylene tetrahydromethanopterin reductase-like flavin-dependent oxidoreductase (luciferase family)